MGPGLVLWLPAEPGPKAGVLVLLHCGEGAQGLRCHASRLSIWYPEALLTPTHTFLHPLEFAFSFWDTAGH